MPFAIATQNIKNQVKCLSIKDLFNEKWYFKFKNTWTNGELCNKAEKIQYSKMSTGQKIIYDFKMQF